MKTTSRQYALAVVALILGTAWLGLSVSGLLREFGDSLSGILPSWFLIANLVLCPFFAALASLRLGFRTRIQLLLLAVFVTSASLIGVAYRSRPLATLVVLVVLYIEMFWFIPRWNSGRKDATE